MLSGTNLGAAVAEEREELLWLKDRVLPEKENTLRSSSQ